MTTLYIPLGLAAFGIVLRGSGFAFRKVSLRTPEQRFNGIAFAARYYPRGVSSNVWLTEERPQG